MPKATHPSVNVDSTLHSIKLVIGEVFFHRNFISLLACELPRLKSHLRSDAISPSEGGPASRTRSKTYPRPRASLETVDR